MSIHKTIRVIGAPLRFAGRLGELHGVVAYDRADLSPMFFSMNVVII